MKTFEDEAFDELARKQGAWGGFAPTKMGDRSRGFKSKQAMAANKLWDKPSVAFDEWWNGDNDESANPFWLESGAYWAWAGWKAALAQRAQRTWIWLSDADIAEVVDTTCQYSGGYEEYLIKKAERKIRSMNT